MSIFQKERLPTVGEIIEVVRTMPYHVERCVHVKRDGPNTFLDEVFIDVLGIWVDFNGRWYRGDRARGFYYPGWFQAWRLRRNLRRCGKRMGWL